MVPQCYNHVVYASCFVLFCNLTLKTPDTTAADDIHIFLLFLFFLRENKT